MVEGTRSLLKDAILSDPGKGEKVWFLRGKETCPIWNWTSNFGRLDIDLVPKKNYCSRNWLDGCGQPGNARSSNLGSEPAWPPVDALLL